MALYSLQDFQKLVASSKLNFLNVRRVTSTLDKLDWSNQDLENMLCGMHPNDFQKTVPNCKINDFPGEEYVNADQYEVHWDEDAGVRRDRPTMSTVSFSLKIAIMVNRDNQLSGLVTFHLSGSPY